MRDWFLPSAARRERRRDRRGPQPVDPGPRLVLDANLAWLAAAQDSSRPVDGGVAKHYSLLTGWSSSYPETTGYIVPTVLAHARDTRDGDLRERARCMLDWLVDIQYPNGSIQGGRIDSSPRVPVTFNTGQVLLGLAAGVVEFGDRYRDAMNGAATWLRDSLDPDGCWRRYPTPFAIPGEKAYETHVSWGLFEAARVEANRGYGEAGLKQVDWALTKQRANGWFADCCLVDPSNPLTHTIAYALRGVIEAYRFSQDRRYLMAARETADRIIGVMSPDGHLAGRFDANWRPKVKWVCLTGTAQMAACWFILHRITGELRYRAAALKANEFVRRTVSVSGPPEIRGGVKGSFTVDGDYGRFEYLSWAAKFCADANMMELGIDREAVSHSSPATAYT